MNITSTSKPVPHGDVMYVLAGSDADTHVYVPARQAQPLDLIGAKPTPILSHGCVSHGVEGVSLYQVPPTFSRSCMNACTCAHARMHTCMHARLHVCLPLPAYMQAYM